ncbi:MAG: DUF2163 domain-containing protein [Erythrobacter sp.]|uniref:DUF2163 domain-containing protein n=1 Tax=Erythrobacter sp. TaxID=1042 RepID=UPI001B0F5A70|nr:DUF2163 domain-containing protein [Erythrobacter sp.]MBO6767071.1 DUF2163 domain-containing protein [Erythrobacter sp.]
MSRVFFGAELETAAIWWRVFRKDGVTLGFTTHDRDLWFDGVLHRAAPGMLPSAIRRTAGFEDDPSDIEGALSHAAVTETDLASGRFDGAWIECGIVDWETREAAALYSGSIVGVSREGAAFKAELASAKTRLSVDPIPLSSPSCRARFCGPGCGLNPIAFQARARVLAVDHDANDLTIDLAQVATFRHGELRWIDGPMAGLSSHITDVVGDRLILAERIDADVQPGLRLRVTEGCDRTIATCSARFDNAANFRGEPFLPGNDMLAQYPVAR